MDGRSLAPTAAVRRCTCLAACALLSFAPAWAARRTEHLSLRRAFAAHFVAVLVGLFLILVIVQLWDRAARGLALGSLVGFDKIMDEIADSFVKHPFVATGVTLLGAAAIELVFVGLAFIFACWGARAERFRDSLRNSLRQTWLHTWHVVLAIAMVGTLLVCLEQVWYSWRVQHQHPWPQPSWPMPKPPTMPIADPSYAAAFAAYSAAVNAWHTECHAIQWQWRSQSPWLSGHLEGVLFVSSFAAGLWTLWALLRSIGARPFGAGPVESPRCDRCGYDLTAAAGDGNCPECGLPVAESTGTAARAGAAWEFREQRGRLMTWRQTTVAAVRRPGVFARVLRVWPTGRDHRRFLAIHLPIALGLGAAGFIISGILASRREPVGIPPQVFFVNGAIVGSLCVAGTVVLACLGATAAGLIIGRQVRRNLLPGAIQVACYQSVYTLVWIAFGGLWLATVTSLENHGVFDALSGRSRLNAGFMMFCAYVIPNGFWFLGYFLLVYRGTSAMRFANR